MTISEYNKKFGDIPIQRPANVSTEQWQKAVDLYNIAKSKGDRYPELTVAQAALETRWFKSPSGNFNYFGQKATQNQRGTDFSTKEVSNNKAYSTRARFRDYSNLGEAVDDRIKKWSSKYAGAENVDQAIGSIWQYDPETGQGKGYATDDKYGSKLKNILGMMGVESNYSAPQPQENITTEVTNLESPQKNTTFATPPLPTLPTKDDEKAEKLAEKENTTKEKDALLQRQKEYEFLQEILGKVTEEPQRRQQEQPQQQLETPSILQRYNQVSQIVGMQEGGQIPVSNRGVYEHPNEKVLVPTPNGTITMTGVNYPILGISQETNEQKLMMPNVEQYFFKDTQNVLEIPLNKR